MYRVDKLYCPLKQPTTTELYGVAYRVPMEIPCSASTAGRSAERLPSNVCRCEDVSLVCFPLKARRLPVLIRENNVNINACIERKQRMDGRCHVFYILSSAICRSTLNHQSFNSDVIQD